MTRIAIVTGAAQGIGEAVALRLAVDGLDVVVSDLPAKREQLASLVKRIETTGRRAMAVEADVSEEQDVIALIDKTAEAFGGLDVMVANAGICMFKPMFDSTPSVDDLNTILSINVRGVMLCYKHAAMQMVKQDRGGRIIGASSGAAKKAIPNMAAYSASKYAVRGLTQACAAEWRKHKITVNTYAPGSILTPMVLHPDDEKNGGPASTAKLATGLPLDTPDAEPVVIADFVSYLIRPESYHITGRTTDSVYDRCFAEQNSSGQSVNIDGGLNYD
ncbi:short chain oxidoreductase [Fomitopsis serialis]|uniref:short chain oxidoreductase n=1 Tax=Fomitopsis serialis TaxID=139415 RepID=UPI0020073251|nr:short chain oxidoreductase [Neoantrodia serialis]KAH9914832.1 short chain oxidoreductase [Neoantrodia serialis]